MKRILPFLLLFMLVIPVSAAEVSPVDVLYDTASVGRWDAYFGGKPFGDLSVSEGWQLLDGPVRVAGIGALDSHATLERRLLAFERKYAEVRYGLLQSLVNVFLDVDAIRAVVDFDASLGVYRLKDERSGIWIVSQDGSFPYYSPDTVLDPDTGDTSISLGGQWILYSQVDWTKTSVLSEYSLYDLGYDLRDIGQDNDVEIYKRDGNPFYKYVRSAWTAGSVGGYYVYCDSAGNPYVSRVEPDGWAQDQDNNWIIDDDGNTENGQLIDVDTSTIWFPDGTLNFINNLVYDESSKTYYVDASSSYDIDNNNYYTYNYHYEYHIDYTSITYIGQTAEYDEVYEYYYQLPDGRSSADLTAEELQALNTQIDVLPYIRSADDTSIRALYHFDGDTRDSSYWSYAGDFKWNSGASLTYMDAGAFDGALYLSELEHDFTIALPANLGTGDFTVQFRYYQSATPAPVSDSTLLIGGFEALGFNGEALTSYSGVTSFAPITPGAWNEVCVMRSGGTVYRFLNGVPVSSFNNANSLGNEINFHFGSEQQTYKYFDELRVVSEAVYPVSGYEPTAVPHDTNLALVLPDSQVPVADAYWSIESSGENLLSQWDFDNFTEFYSPYTLVNSASPSTATYAGATRFTNMIFSNFDVYGARTPVLFYNSSMTQLSTDSSGTSLVAKKNSVSGGGYSLANISTDLVPGVPGDDASASSWSTVPYSMVIAVSAGHTHSAYSWLEPDTTYTFSMVADTGEVGSLVFTTPASFIENQGTSVNSIEFNGYRLFYACTGSSFMDPTILGIQPLEFNTSGKFVYLEVIEGDSTDLTAEYIESVVAMDKDDLHTPSLAVRTDLNITGYQIGGVRPSLPTKGLVWALVEAGRISSLQIYNGQAWEEVDGRIWTGSRWVPYYAYDVLLLKDMWDIVEADPSLNPIYTEAGFWKWLQEAWGEMMGKLDQIIEALGGSPSSGDTCAHVYESEISREATCSEPGHMTYTCTLCGHTYVELIDTVGHDWLVTDIVDDSSTDYVFVDSLDECTDISKKYVLPDGQVYEWYEAPYPIPEGYQQLDYIEATGSQYLDTGFTPNQDTRSVVEFKFFSGTGIYGARDSTSSNGFSMRVTNSRWQPQYGDTMARTSESDVTDWHTADQDKNKLSMDGNLARTFTYSEFEAPVTFILGGINASNDIYYGKGQYRYCELYDNGTLIRQFTPCIDPSGDVGMYDLVNGVFYGSSGESSFVAGNILGDGPSRWISTGKQDDFTYTYKELTCSKCGAVSRDYGDGPEEVDLFDILGDCVSFLYGLLSGTVFRGVSDFFSAFTDGSLFEGFQQTDENGNTTTGLPEGVGAVFADFSGMISALPTELLSVLVFGICLLFLLAVFMLF